MSTFALASRGDVDSSPSSLRVSEREVARLITAAESGHAVDAACPDPYRRSRVVGITGPPGSGKSTLVDALVAHVRERGLTVAVLSIDPSSERTGGAVLADRVRMTQHSADRGVYIRSMATRGSMRGPAHAARDAVRVLDEVMAELDSCRMTPAAAARTPLDTIQVASIHQV